MFSVDHNGYLNVCSCPRSNSWVLLEHNGCKYRYNESFCIKHCNYVYYIGDSVFLKIMYMQKGRNSVWYFNVNSLLYYMSI